LKLLTSDLMLALDAVKFAEMLGVEADPWQQTALRWKGKKLLMCCSRQAGKSTVSAIIALHRIIFVPGSLVLLVSPSQRQSSELFKKVSEFIKLLPVQLEKIEDNKLSVQLKSGSRVVSLPSTEATIRGYSGASLIIVDEAARLPDHIFFSISPMVAVSQGQMILLSTPAGKRGFFHDAYTNKGDEWATITVTADQCPRINAEFLEKERAQIGDFYFRQEYLCEFLEPEGSLFTLEQINNCFTDDFDGWDISIKKGVILSE
jgi:hypothetical protein